MIETNYDVVRFMRASDQLAQPNPDLYFKLIAEEHQELLDAVAANDEVETLDAILDLIWVLTGYGISLGLPIVAGWNEVARSNKAKIDKNTGKVLKNAAGKVQKPAGWTPPDLERIIKEHRKKQNGNQD